MENTKKRKEKLCPLLFFGVILSGTVAEVLEEAEQNTTWNDAH